MIKKSLDWEFETNKIIDDIKVDFHDEVELRRVPKHKITQFSIEESISILLLLENNSQCQNANLWLEKIRRYSEINRPKLLSVSKRRFGGASVALEVLQAMATTMAYAAFLKKSAIYYNATCAIGNALARKHNVFIKDDSPSRMLVHMIISNPSYFIGRKHEI